MATISRVFLFLQTRTSPNAPRPMIFSGSKSRTVIFARLTSNICIEIYLRHAVQFGLLVLQFLLYMLFLGLCELHFVHLWDQLVPGLFFLAFFSFLLGILWLYVCFDAFGALSCRVGGLVGGLLVLGGRSSRCRRRIGPLPKICQKVVLHLRLLLLLLRLLGLWLRLICTSCGRTLLLADLPGRALWRILGHRLFKLLRIIILI